MDSSIQETDFLVLGSGIAGLYYALHVADHGRVTIVTAGPLRFEHALRAGRDRDRARPRARLLPEPHRGHAAVGAGLCKDEVASTSPSRRDRATSDA